MNEMSFLAAVAFAVLITVSDTSSNDDTLTKETLSALERVVAFYERDYHSVNLDGVFGLRFAEGALLSVLQDEEAGHLRVSREYQDHIRKLTAKASTVAKKTLPHLKRQSPSYFQKFEEQVSGPWQNFKSFHKLDNKLYIPISKRNYVAFDEETSDGCMLEVKGHSCHISDQCWDLMTAKGTDGYTLTHQALYLLLAEKHGCESQMLPRLRQLNINGLQEMYGRICASMYPQMMEIEEKRELESSVVRRDLYLEQAMVCGSMGYPQFLTQERLKNIFRWQRDDGCFGNVRKEQKMLLNDGHQNKGIGLHGDADERRETVVREVDGTHTMRTLLMEKTLEDGCMSHVTGVAVGLLGVYVRWLMYSPTLTFRERHGSNELHDYLMEDNIVHNEPRLEGGHRAARRVVLQKEASVPLAPRPSAAVSAVRLACMFSGFAAFVAVIWKRRKFLPARLSRFGLFRRKGTHVV